MTGVGHNLLDGAPECSKGKAHQTRHMEQVKQQRVYPIHATLAKSLPLSFKN